MTMHLKYTLVIACILTQFGCAVLHKVQLSDVEGSTKGKPVNVKVSEETLSLSETAALAEGLKHSVRGMGDVARSVGIFKIVTQLGPHTGTPIYNELYARDIPERLASECKNGYLSNITSIRETVAYPLIKGEIIHINATCNQFSRSESL